MGRRAVTGAEVPEKEPGLPIHGAPLRFAPENEQGVVAIFAAIAKARFGMTVERIQTGYPDCIAIRRGKRVRIEFEFRSRNFTPHLKDDPLVKDCDAIVCWEHNWPAVPEHLEVIELRQEFGVGRNVWLQPYEPGQADRMTHEPLRGWSSPASAAKGDLLIVYRSRPDSRLEHVFKLTSSPYVGAHWNDDSRDAVYADFARVGDLPTPVGLSVLKSDAGLRHAPFVRSSVQGPQRITTWWPALRRLIVQLDPKNERVLKDWPGDLGL